MFRARFLNNQALDATDQTDVLRVLEAASRRVDDHCRRTFYAEVATRHFDGNGCSLLLLPDLLGATSVKLDEDMDRTFELTLAAATDYFLLRHGYRDPARRLERAAGGLPAHPAPSGDHRHVGLYGGGRRYGRTDGFRRCHRH